MQVCNLVIAKTRFLVGAAAAFLTPSTLVTIIRFSEDIFRFHSIRYDSIRFFSFFFLVVLGFLNRFVLAIVSSANGVHTHTQTHQCEIQQRSNFVKLQECVDGIPIRFYVSVFLVEMK